MFYLFKANVNNKSTLFKRNKYNFTRQKNKFILVYFFLIHTILL